MNDNLPKSIGIAILTWRSKCHLCSCLTPLLKSSLKPRILIIDSSSNDGTLEWAQQMGIEILVIPQAEFNHGLTRELARQHLKTDIIVMITPDAYASDEKMLEKLIAPIVHNKASVAYARQLPHAGAGLLEAFPREFNYPEKSHVRSLKDLDHFGVYTYFCSNSCAAYCNKALDEIGGFSQTLTGEDTVAVAKLLLRQHSIAYVSEATVHHSHNYSLKQEFHRYFDTGYARKEHQHLLKSPGGDEKRGKDYTKQLFREVIRKKPLLLPYTILQTGAKLLGYKLGQISHHAPTGWKKKLSSQITYWDKFH